jgi:hypothetical protein
MFYHKNKVLLFIDCDTESSYHSAAIILSWFHSHELMSRGGHGLPKVLQGSAMPHPFMPYGRVTLALQPFQG